MFVNPSTIDVVATTTAEALAMGKWAVVPDLPCPTLNPVYPERRCLSTPATTTAEALAMGKWAVVADLPCPT